MVQILSTDTYYEMAKKIYYQFEVGQSCTIKGFIWRKELPYAKGSGVLEELERMDKEEHTNIEGRRKRVKPKHTVGGYAKDKMFKYKRETRNGILMYTIWRLQ